MRILFVDCDPQYVNGLPSGLRQLGCDVMVLSSLEKDDFKLTFDLFQPHVLFTAGWTKLHTRTNLEMLGEYTVNKNIIHAYWATEDPRWTEKWSVPFVKRAKPTHVFTIDPDSVSLYQKMGLVASYLPWACNPEYHRPVPPKEEYKCDLAVVATAGITWQGFRRKAVKLLIKPLVEREYNIKIWGARWEQLNSDIVGFSVPDKYLCGKLPYHETNAVYSSAKIVLGIQNRTDELNSRTFEIMAAGGFMLAPDTEAIRAHFTPGQHLAVSGSEEQTIETVDYYLNNDALRHKVARQGRQKVITEHNYRNRAKEVLAVLTGG
ncbi:CgeB family protein [Desulfofalx alkaliphila]|uniref:CgeB family protein n=1 Tax=Desulfofalx alkaliphila TaxID=105483 RepID=UPI0004E16441|nr:glycosyltransferase [Desulfofalx alkaliphila]